MTASVVRQLCARTLERVLGFVQEPTAAGQIRRRVFFFIPLPLVLLGVLALALRGQWSAQGWTILMSGSIAVGSLLLAIIAQPTPLPEGLPPRISVHRSLHRFRQITDLRLGLAMTPVVMGAALTVAGGGLFPYTVALVLAWPQLLLALPGYFTVSRSRRAMEAWGTKAYLWAGLAQPTGVDWPFVTRLIAYRRARAADARQEGRAADGRDADARHQRQEETEKSEGLPGVPDRLAPPDTPMTPVESVVPGFRTAQSGPTPRPSLQLLRLRANTRPKRRATPRATQRNRTRSDGGG